MNPSDMTNEQLRIAVAEALGYKVERGVDQGLLTRYQITEPGGHVFRVDYIGTVLPNWPEDLNACHGFEKGLTDIEFCRYTQILCGHTTPGEKIHWGGEDAWRACHSTARQRCLALLETLKGGSP